MSTPNRTWLMATVVVMGAGIASASPARSGDGPQLVEALLQRTETVAQRALDPAFRAAATRALSALAATELQDRAARGDGIAPLDLGDSTAHLVYTAVAPCRLIDTRRAGGSLAGGATREFRVTGGDLSPQGGNPAGCGVPHGRATSAIVNFVAVNPAGIGNLRAWAYSTPPVDPPQTSVLNYASVPGLNIANGIAVALCDVSATTCTYDLRVRADGSGTHLVADVVGYFERFPTEQVYPGLVPAGAMLMWDQSTDCPAGYTRVASMDARFPRGAPAPGQTGGAEAHAHDISHVHGMANHTHGGTTANGGVDHTHSGETSGIHRGLDFVLKSDGGHVSNHTHVFTTGGASAYLHAHTFSSGGPSTNTTEASSAPTSGSASSLPPYVDVLFCRKN